MPPKTKKKAKRKAKPTAKKQQRAAVKKAAKQDSGGTLAERRAKIRERYDRQVVVYADDPPAEFAPIDFVMLARLLGGGIKQGAVVEIAGWEDSGKMQHVDEPVLTPTGWKRIGDLVIGDLVIGADGKPTPVDGVFPQGVLESYEVTFSDGAKTECGDEHLWLTRTMLDRERGTPGSVKTLSDIRRTIRRGRNPNHSIPLVSPVEFAVPQDLPIDPYTLGLLIGDGSIIGSSVVLHNPERDVVDRFESGLPYGDLTSPYESPGKCLATRVRSPVMSASSATAEALRDLGLAGCRSYEKFIPEPYRFASIEDRRNLLLGLMDTDGTVDKPGQPSVSYSTSSERLADDVAFLVRSLGGIARTTSRIPRYKYRGLLKNGRRTYRISIQFPCGWCPVSSEKHVSRWSPPRLIKHRSIVGVRAVGAKESVCISVAAPDGLYVTRDFIVTHNTSLVVAIAGMIQRAAPEGKKHVVMVNFEIVEDRVWWATLGLQTDDDHFTMIANVPLEEGIGALADLIRSGEVCCAIVDSVYAASSRANDELLNNWADPKGKQGGGGGIGVEARQWGVAWTAMKGLFTEFGVICLAVNQVRIKIEMGGGGKKSYGPPPTTTPRGSALKFYAWIRLELTGRLLVDDKNKKRTDVDGRQIRIRVIKNKTSGDQRGLCHYDLIRGQGFDLTNELIELAKEAGAIRQKGGWYYIGKATKVQGAAKLRAWVEAEPRRRDVLRQVVKRYLSKVDDDELFEEVNLDADDE